MNSLTTTTHVGNVTLTRILPVRSDIVHLALTAHIPEGSSRFTPEALHLYSTLVLTKTKKKSKEALEAYMMAHGINLSVTAGRETITFTGSVRLARVRNFIDLLTELIFEGDIDEHEFGQKKKLALEANREAHDNAKRIALINFTNALYPHEPRAQLHTLTEEKSCLVKATRSESTQIHRALPTSRWYLSIVGTPLAEYHALRLVKKLEHTSTAYVPKTIVARPVAPQRHFATVPGKTNIEVFIGNVSRIPQNTDQACIPFEFGIDVLGKVGGFSGRLMSTVREKEGLTYGIYAHTASSRKGDSFHFLVRTFFMAKDYTQGYTSTMREIELIRTKGITEKELTTFKDILRNEAILACESSESRLRLFHGLVVSGHDERDRHETLKRIEGITRKEVNDALRTYLDPDSLVVSAAGPITKNGTPLITEKS